MWSKHGVINDQQYCFKFPLFLFIAESLSNLADNVDFPLPVKKRKRALTNQHRPIIHNNLPAISGGGSQRMTVTNLDCTQWSRCNIFVRRKKLRRDFKVDLPVKLAPHHT